MPYTLSCLPNPPIWDETTINRMDENRAKLRHSDDASLGRLFLEQPLETLVNFCEELSEEQIASVPDDTFDQFFRLRPAGACLFASRRLSESQIAYCLERHPWDILFHAPFLLDSDQLGQCVIDYPDLSLICAAKYLQPDVLVSLCISHTPLASDALSDNAYRFSPEHFVRLLGDPSAMEAIAKMIVDEDEKLVERRIVFARLWEALNGLSETEREQASPVILAIASLI